MTKTIVTISMILGLAVAAFGVTKIFVLKPVYDIQIAGLSNQMLQMQRNNQIQNAQQWYWFWQMKVTEYTAANVRQPRSQVIKSQLDHAIQERNKWQAEVNKLMTP